MDVLTLIGLWCVASFVTAPLLGRAIGGRRASALHRGVQSLVRRD